MLERIGPSVGRHSRHLRRRIRIMAVGLPQSQYNIDPRTIREIDLNVLLTGFFQAMQRKYRTEEPSQNVLDAINQLVRKLEFDYEMRFDKEVDYDLTDSESSGETPPPAKKRRAHERRMSSGERFNNRFEKRIRKLVYAEDTAHGTLFHDDLSKKCCVADFINRSGLNQSEVEEFLPRPSET